MKAYRELLSLLDTDALKAEFACTYKEAFGKETASIPQSRDALIEGIITNDKQISFQTNHKLQSEWKEWNKEIS